MSTKKYIDGTKGLIDTLLTPAPIVEVKKVAVEPIVDIDPDIEREIAQLQEANFAEKIKEIKLVEKKEEPTVELADELGSFFGAISKAKTNLTKKIEKEEAKIAGLEDLFKEMAEAKKKKVEKKVLLLEPEKDVIDVEVEEAIQYGLDSIKPEEIVEEETIEEKIEEKLEDKMIAKVKKQISGMRNANELDKEKVKQLASLDSWEKLKEEFLNFKHTVNVQLGTVGGGGLDPHNINSDFLPSQTTTYSLGSSSRRWKDLFLAGNTIDLAGATISSDGTGAIAIAATGAILPKGSKTEDGNELAVMGSQSTGTLSQPIRRIDFFSAVGGLSTPNATFEFNAEVADRYSFIDSASFTLANGSALTDSGITLFQL
jgi:hypothetical protein